MNKKILSFILAASMAAACSTAVSAGEQEGGIVVLYTNDIHCAVNEDEENQVLGYARIAGLKKQLEAPYPRANISLILWIRSVTTSPYPETTNLITEWISSCLLRRKRLFPTCPVTLRI